MSLFVPDPFFTPFLGSADLSKGPVEDCEVDLCGYENVPEPGLKDEGCAADDTGKNPVGYEFVEPELEGSEGCEV